MRIAIVILLIVLAILQYHLWFAKDGVLNTFCLKKAISSLQIKNVTTAKQNLSLAEDIKTLKKDGTAIENKARTDLGMVKKGEVFYQVVK